MSSSALVSATGRSAGRRSRSPPAREPARSFRRAGLSLSPIHFPSSDTAAGAGGLCPVLASHALEVSSAGIAVGVTFQWNCICEVAEWWKGVGVFPRAHALHAGEFAPLLRCASIILPTGDDRRLTELSNVVAYPCRLSSRGSTPCTPLSFLWMPLHRRPEFQPPAFSIGQNGLRQLR